jgi:hypothetical protein
MSRHQNHANHAAPTVAPEVKLARLQFIAQLAVLAGFGLKIPTEVSLSARHMLAENLVKHLVDRFELTPLAEIALKQHAIVEETTVLGQHHVDEFVKHTREQARRRPDTSLAAKLREGAVTSTAFAVGLAYGTGAQALRAAQAVRSQVQRVEVRSPIHLKTKS